VEGAAPAPPPEPPAQIDGIAMAGLATSKRGGCLLGASHLDVDSVVQRSSSYSSAGI
jgi:hypothetical protein